MKRTIILFIALLVTTISVSAQSGLTILSYNIRNARGLDGRLDYKRISAVIKNSNADVVGIQELDSVTGRSGKIDVLGVLAQETGLHPAYGAAIQYDGGKYGVGVLSKEQPIRHYNLPLPGREEKRTLLVVEFRKYIVFCTHFSLTEEDRIESVKIISAEAKKNKKKIFLIGDLNAEPGSEVVTMLTKEWQLLSGVENTIPADKPEKCIDYIFCSNKRKCNVVHKEVINEPVASDHRPILVELK